MKITVTQDDIDNGHRNDCERCPVAIAIRRCIDVPYGVDVGGNTRIITPIGNFKYPSTVRKFIHNFDNQLTVKPFTFNLK